MTPGLFIALALCGGLGAAARYLLDGWVQRRTGGSYPWGTMLINLTGSLVLGFLTGLVTARLAPPAWQLVLGTGFLGGYTTFSTASVETVRLLQDDRRQAAVLNGLGTLVGATVAASVGLWCGVRLG